MPLVLMCNAILLMDEPNFNHLLLPYYQYRIVEPTHCTWIEYWPRLL